MKKMKRLLVAMLSCLTAFACVAGMSACKKDDKSGESSQAPAVSSSSVEEVSSEEASSEDSAVDVECAHAWVLDEANSVAPSCGVEGKNVEVCSLCEETKETPVAALEHEWAADEANSVAATCENDGVAAEVCVICNETKSEAIAALGHTIVVVDAIAATCTEAGKEAGEYCESCDYVVEGAEIAALGHNYVVTEEVAATCEAEGKTVETCEACGDVVETPVAALGHTIVVVDAIAATCTEAGKEAGEYCEVCDYAVEGAEIAALGHSVVAVDAIAATCTEAGKEAGEYCEVCDYVVEGAIIDALGHNYTVVSSTEATCEAAGKVVEICYACQDVVETVSPAIGHNYVVTENVAPACAADGKIVETCENCGNVVNTAVAALGHNWIVDEANSIAATCLNPGKKVENCDVCGETKESYVAPNGHTFDDANWVVTTNPTCVSTGIKECKCDYYDVCKGKLSEDTNEGTMDHVWAEPYIKEAQAPTCTEDGWTAHRVCSNEECRYEELSVVIPAIGHDLITTKGWDATCTSEGREDQVVCANCGLIEGGEVIPMDPHPWTVAPTCTADGTCSVCGLVKGSALGHNYKFHEAKYADCANYGTTTFYYECANCKVIDKDDPDCKNPLTPDEFAIVRGGHKYNPDEATCTEGAHCLICDDIVTKTTPHILEWFEGLDPTCSETGYTAYRACVNCNYKQDYKMLDALGHVYAYTEVFELPTCTDTGLMYTGECTREGCDHVGGNVAIEALGHKYKTVSETFANCTEDGVKVEICTVCQEELETVTPALGHTLEEIEARVATCTEIGWDAHNACTVCKYIESYVEYPALGHDFNEYTKVAAVEDDCYTAGNLEYYTCANGCDAIATYNATKDTYTLVAASKVQSYLDGFDKIKHTIDPNYRDPATNLKTYVPAVSATCTEDGHVATGNCKYCGIAMDETWFNANTVEGYTIPALGHDGQRDANFDEDGNYIGLIHKNSKEDTCTQEEYCGFCKKANWNFEENAIDHTYVEVAAYDYLDPTCQYAGNLAYSVCECGQIWAINADTNTLDCVKTYRKDKTGALVEDADGNYIPTAYFKLADVTLAQKKHSYDVLVEGYDPTCTEAGKKDCYICRFCGLEQAGNYVIPALGHTNSLEGKTCSSNLECERCNLVYEHKKADANAHVYTTDGECVSCGECKDHKYEVKVSAPGQYVIYECTVCGTLRTEPVVLA